VRDGRRVHIGFHGVGEPARTLEPGEDEYWISTETFNRILDEVVALPSIDISFDDGNASDVAVGLPALRERGLRGSFFPIADRIGKPGSVDRDGLRDLAANGMTIGSHGMFHRAWRGLGEEALDQELVDARRMIEAESGARVNTAACPLGSYDRRSLQRLRKLGYLRVFTSDRSTANTHAWLQPRYSVRRADSVDDVRALVTSPPGATQRALSAARITAKRWR
jgi:peptidoglycan/xylan/chitin deacetylase (PgdA/CDA1 family)